MKSIFKKLKTIAIMLSGAAVIGGLSVACLPKLSPARSASAEDSGTIYYDNGAFYLLEGTYTDPLILSRIDFYGDISYEGGSADLYFVDNSGTGQLLGNIIINNVEFSTKPTGDGSYYNGEISGTIASTQQRLEEYHSNGARFWHEEVFDPEHEEWTWDESANVYSCDYRSSSTGAVTTYKAAFLPHSGASGENQIICEYTQGSGVANVRTTIYNDNNGDPIETGMTKSFEFLLAEEPSLNGDSYIFLFGTTALYTFSIDAIYVSIVEESTPSGEELTSVILNTHELELVAGAIGELSYQFSPSSYGGTFEWSSNNENIVTVSDKGEYAEVTAVGPGTATIYITSVEYPDISDECVVTVTEQSDPGTGDELEGIHLSSDTLQLFVGEEEMLGFNFIPSTYQGDVQWGTTDDTIVSVTQSGLVIAVSAGTATVVCMSTEYEDIFAECYVTVIRDSDPSSGDELESVSLNKHQLELYVGDTERLSFTTVPEDVSATFSWVSSDANIASVINGEVYANAPGEAEITIEYDSNINICDVCSVVVSQKTIQVETITVPSSVEVINGSSQEFEIDISPSDAEYSLQWHIDDEVVATIDDNGVVTARSYGETTYYVYDQISGITSNVGTISVGRITAETLTITISGEEVTQTNCEAGNTIQFSYSVFPSNAEVELTWSSSDEYVGTVGQYGYFESNKAGTTIITLFDSISQTTVTCSVEVIGSQTEEGLVYDPDHYCFTYASVESDSYTIELSGKTFFYSNETNGDNAYLLFNVMNSGSVVRTVDAFIENAQLGTTMSTEGGEQYVITGNWSNSLSQTVGVELRFDTSPEEINQGLNYSPKNGKFLYAISSNRNDIFLATDTSATYVSDNGGSVTIYFDDISDTATITGCELGYEEDHYVVFGQYEGYDGNITVALSSATEIDGVYKISFDANGGTGSMNMAVIPAGVEMQFGCNFSKENYVFDGWAVDSADSTRIIDVESTLLIDKDYVLYAHWKSTSQEYNYKIIFDGNGATSGSMSNDEFVDSAYSILYTLPSCAYEKRGYTFAGWANTADGFIKYQPGETCNVQSVSDEYPEKIFYATWEQNEFTITFEPNGGSGTMSPITVQKGSNKVPTCSFEREGYTFAGWAVGSPDGTVIQPGDSVNVTANYTLYATWDSTTPEPTPEYRQYWTYIDQELRYVDEAHPDYLTRVDKAIYSERSLTASVLISILNEQEEVVDTKYISLSNASYSIIEEGCGSVTGYFNLLTDEDKVITLEYLEIAVEKIPVTPEEKAADVSEEQIAQINSLLPETQDSRIEEVIGDLNQGTAYQIVEVATDAKSFIDELREEGGEGYTEEDYQRDLQTVQSATEAAVVVGAASKDSNITAQVAEMTKSAPQDTGVNLGGVLKDFYEQQMSYLLGEEVADKKGEQPTRGITRALAPKVNKVDVTDYLSQEFDQMLEFVDRSVDDIEDTLLQVRKCSKESVKMAVNHSITTITSKSFRDFDKDKADREFVETLEPVMMATMQSQVLAVLEEQYNNSDHRNKEKDQVLLDEIDAVKDIETFRIMVMEVLKQKYETLEGSKVYEDLQAFTDEIYWPCFEAWALDKESPVGFTFEELTKATIESSSKRANNYVIATSADKPEIVFISVFAGVSALVVAGAIVVPTVLKKKRRGLAE